MSLHEEIIELEQQLTIMQERLREIRQRVDSLERQNERLRQRVSAEDLVGEGEAALRALYADGFHICPAHFAEGRQEDCLFCLSFLKAQRPEQS